MNLFALQKHKLRKSEKLLATHNQSSKAYKAISGPNPLNLFGKEYYFKLITGIGGLNVFLTSEFLWLIQLKIFQ